MNIIIGAAFLLFLDSALATDYCRPDICPKNLTHICCRNPGLWAKRCGNNHQLYRMTECDKELVLGMHNQHRNEVASGTMKRYPPAVNMLEVTWNDELAEIACYNVITCQMKHDECRTAHKYAGQNLAMTRSNKAYRPFRQAYTSLHTGWFNEHEFCHLDNIYKFENKTLDPLKQIGHFTQMVADKVNEVGCCSSFFERDDFYFTLIACNYNYSNMKKKPVYVTGTPNCKKFSKKYENLCS